MSKPNCIVVIGSTGNIGKEVVSYLIESKRKNVNLNQNNIKEQVIQDIKIIAMCNENNFQSKTVNSYNNEEYIANVIPINLLEKTSVVNSIKALTARFHIISLLFILPQCFSPAEMICAHENISCASISGEIPYILKISSFGIHGDKLLSNKDDNIPCQGELGEAHLVGESFFLKNACGNLIKPNQKSQYCLKELISLCPTSFNTNFIKYDVPSIKENHIFSSPLGYDNSVNWVDVKDIGEVAAKILLDYCLPKYCFPISSHQQVLNSDLMKGNSTPFDGNTSDTHNFDFLQRVSDVSLEFQYGLTCHRVLPITGGERDNLTAKGMESLINSILLPKESSQLKNEANELTASNQSNFTQLTNEKLTKPNVTGNFKKVEYIMSDLPPSSGDTKPYHDLWIFLRNGGFNTTKNTVNILLDREPTPFEETLRHHLKDVL